MSRRRVRALMTKIHRGSLLACVPLRPLPVRDGRVVRFPLPLRMPLMLDVRVVCLRAVVGLAAAALLALAVARVLLPGLVAARAALIALLPPVAARVVIPRALTMVPCALQRRVRTTKCQR